MERDNPADAGGGEKEAVSSLGATSAVAAGLEGSRFGWWQGDLPMFVSSRGITANCGNRQLPRTFLRVVCLFGVR
jgi:hypothetical protein